MLNPGLFWPFSIYSLLITGPTPTVSKLHKYTSVSGQRAKGLFGTMSSEALSLGSVLRNEQSESLQSFIACILTWEWVSCQCQ